MEKEYAQALFSLSQKPGASADHLVEKLAAHLRATGREKLLPRILREFKRIAARASRFDTLLEVADEKHKHAAEKEAHELGIIGEAQVNPMLVSGWRARVGSRVVDQSGKRALLDLYRKIAANA